jgi:hypothetical protein
MNGRRPMAALAPDRPPAGGLRQSARPHLVPSALTPPVSLGPQRRVGVRGAHVLTFDPAGPELGTRDHPGGGEVELAPTRGGSEPAWVLHLCRRAQGILFR